MPLFGGDNPLNVRAAPRARRAPDAHVQQWLQRRAKQRLMDAPYRVGGKALRVVGAPVGRFAAGQAIFAPMVAGEVSQGLVKHRAGMLATTSGIGKVASFKARAQEALIGAGVGGLVGAVRSSRRKPQERGGAGGIAHDVLTGAGGGTALSLVASALIAQQLRGQRREAVQAALKARTPLPEDFRKFWTASQRGSSARETQKLEAGIKRDLLAAIAKDPQQEALLRQMASDAHADARDALARRIAAQRTNQRSVLTGDVLGMDPEDAQRAQERLQGVLKEYLKGSSGLYGRWDPAAARTTSLFRPPKTRK